MKRSLKAQAKRAEKKILRENEDFYNDITRQYFPKKERKLSKRKSVIMATSIAIACVIIVICLSFTLNYFLKDDYEYLLQNEVIEGSDLNDLVGEVPWFPFIDEQKYDCQVLRIYDSVTNDELFFESKFKRL